MESVNQKIKGGPQNIKVKNVNVELTLRKSSQMTNEQVAELEKQQYRMAGNHSAVKICSWTKKMLRGEGECYKFKFYGIRSHQCMQMTTSLYCANRCTFCWRGQKAPVSDKWYGCVDEPGEIMEKSLKQQKDLLYGFKGNKEVNKKLYDASEDVRHVALSLVGEPLTYPKINELLDDFHKKRISTFLVTNGQFPEQIRTLKPVTQLYLSLDAADPETLKEVDKPLFKDYWERHLRALDEFAKRKERTCIRLSIIKDVNDSKIDKYAELIKKGDPDFIEVKGYVHVGASREFLDVKNMPYHKEIKEFSEKLIEYLPEYEIVDGQEASKVYCLMKKGLKLKRYINFNEFFKRVNSKEGIESPESYSSKTICSNK